MFRTGLSKIHVAIFLATASFVAGCATGEVSHRPLVEVSDCTADRRPVEPPIRHEGSLWNENGPLSDLFAAQKARRIGDILTVNIVESATASNKADTKTERKSDLSGGIDNFFNMEKWYPSRFQSDKIGNYINPFAALKAELNSTFDGTGTTNRSGSLSAYISVRVTDIMPNGNMKIAGAREITVNNETQYIMLSGIVRPRDISSENVVLSTYIADARIEYSGVGVVDDRQRPGWLMRIMDSAWPF